MQEELAVVDPQVTCSTCNRLENVWQWHHADWLCKCPDRKLGLHGSDPGCEHQALSYIQLHFFDGLVRDLTYGT